MEDGFHVIGAGGTQVTTGAASAAVPIPNDASGARARRVRLTALANCYVRPGFAGTTCTANDVLLTPNEALLLDVRAFTHIAYLQEAPAARFNVTPVEG